jgi:cyclopropane fatty-acyl-phospholipid synthase-like methyltransferase
MNLAECQRQYQQLKRELAGVGWISEGYVQDRGPGAGGPCYQWSRKVRAKTISVALSREQYLWLKKAIENWKGMKTRIKEMQRLSRRVLFQTVPGPPRRKRLSTRVLGTN